MAIPIVPHLQAHTFNVPLGQIVYLPLNVHRTYFAFRNSESHVSASLYLWVGNKPRPAAVEDWIYYGPGEGGSFTYGVAGPLYIASAGQGEGAVLALSNLTESDAEITPIADAPGEIMVAGTNTNGHNDDDHHHHDHDHNGGHH